MDILAIVGSPRLNDSTGNRPGDVRHNLSLVAKARELGRQMVASLK